MNDFLCYTSSCFTDIMVSSAVVVVIFKCLRKFLLSEGKDLPATASGILILDSCILYHYKNCNIIIIMFI